MQLMNDLHNVEVVEMKFSKKIKGLYCNGIIAINSEIDTMVEKNCVLAEELGHHLLTVGDITDQNIITNRKQEKTARNWAYEKLVPVTKLISAYECGCKNRYEIADFLNVTEDFLEDAVKHYSEKYGLFKKVNGYAVYFEPLGVMKIFE